MDGSRGRLAVGKGLLNTLWRPIVEAFGFFLGVVALMAGAVIGDGGHDGTSPATLGAWLTFERHRHGTLRSQSVA